MGIVVVDLSISVDGFVAGPNDGPGDPLGEGGGRLFAWWTSGTETVGPDERFRPSPASAAVAREMFDYGAVITGRRTFDIARGWGGRHPLGCPFFLLTHRPPAHPVGPGTGGQVVTEGIERALSLAQAAAGDRVVSVCGPDVARQCLRAGLLDEIRLSVAPVLLGGGVRLFDPAGGPAPDLECTRVVDGGDVVHLRYRVRR
jgi:dihydrofolate reductase